MKDKVASFVVCPILAKLISGALDLDELSLNFNYQLKDMIQHPLKDSDDRFKIQVMRASEATNALNTLFLDINSYRKNCLANPLCRRCIFIGQKP